MRKTLDRFPVPNFADVAKLIAPENAPLWLPAHLEWWSQGVSEAARIAKAAQACAQAGSLSEAVTISMDIEQLIYEAGRLHDAASLLNRLAQD